MSGLPKLPRHLWDAANSAIDHRDDLWGLGKMIAWEMCSQGYTEDECADWLIDQSPLRGNYTARQFEYQLRRAVTAGYESFDPARRMGQAQEPIDPQAFQRLLAEVEAAKFKRDKRYWVALVQHAINHGVNPVYCSCRKLAEVAGFTSATAHIKANEAMQRMARTVQPGGLAVAVSMEGNGEQSRLWTLNPEWQRGYVNSMHDTYVPLSDSEVEAKRQRAERRLALKAEREHYDRLYELRMRYFAWEAKRHLGINWDKAPSLDPFEEAPVTDVVNPFAGPKIDLDAIAPSRSLEEWPDPDLSLTPAMVAFLSDDGPPQGS